MLHLLPIIGLALFAALAPPQEAESTDAPKHLLPGGAGLEVVVDPVTGEIVDDPSYRQLERLAEGIDLERRGSAWDLREFRLSSGGRGVDLDGWADHSLAIEITDDGQARFVCSQGDRHETPEIFAGDGDERGGNER